MTECKAISLFPFDVIRSMQQPPQVVKLGQRAVVVTAPRPAGVGKAKGPLDPFLAGWRNIYSQTGLSMGPC